jgi:hypothetical protein
MRKFVLSALALFVCLGVTLAGEVVFVKFDKEKKELTVKEDDKEKTYKITDDTKVKYGDMEVPADKVGKVWGRFEKAKDDGKFKFEIMTDKDKVTEIKLKAPKKNKDK